MKLALETEYQSICRSRKCHQGSPGDEGEGCEVGGEGGPDNKKKSDIFLVLNFFLHFTEWVQKQQLNSSNCNLCLLFYSKLGI